MNGQDIQKIMQLHKKGCTGPEIAEEIGCSPQNIGYWRKKLGLKRNYHNNRINPCDVARLHKKGLNVVDMASELGVSEQAIYRWIKKLGLSHTTYKKINPGEIHALFKKGLSNIEIARRMSMPPQTVSYWKKKLHIPMRHRKNFMEGMTPEILGFFLTLYHAGFSDRRIAQVLGVGYYKVRVLRFSVFRLPPSYGVWYRPYSGWANSLGVDDGWRHQEKKCGRCGRVFITENVPWQRYCGDCKEISRKISTEIQAIRRKYNILKKFDPAEARELSHRMAREEGEEFTELALDGLAHNGKKTKEDD